MMLALQFTHVLLCVVAVGCIGALAIKMPACSRRRDKLMVLVLAATPLLQIYEHVASGYVAYASDLVLMAAYTLAAARLAANQACEWRQA